MKPKKIKTASIRIPRRFYVDHIERDLPAPGILKSTKAHFWISALGRDLKELLDDAEFYADPYGPSEIDIGLKSSARATAKAIRAHMAE